MKSKRNPILPVWDIGVIAYREARELQENQINRCLAGEDCEGIFVCEHKPVLTSGLTSQRERSPISSEFFEQYGIEIIETNRGGRWTWHGPGQIVIYPVICLRNRDFGVRSFIATGLGAVKNTLEKFGIESDISLMDAGVWCKDGTGRNMRKLASVGLKILHGYTCHGFSLNFNCDLSVYEMFSPCGFSGEVMSSVAAEALRNQIASPDVAIFKEVLSNEVSKGLSRVGAL